MRVLLPPWIAWLWGPSAGPLFPAVVLILGLCGLMGFRLQRRRPWPALVLVPSIALTVVGLVIGLSRATRLGELGYEVWLFAMAITVSEAVKFSGDRRSA